MSVDFLVCKRCGKTFCDCGDFVSCECGETWCSDECAEADGFREESCKLGCNKDEDEMDACIDKEEYNKTGYVSCWNCENHIDSSCSFCRNEDYDDWVLLYEALKLLGMNREDLIERINKDKKENKND